jgi:hypothetical protein
VIKKQVILNGILNLTPKSQNERLWWLLGKPVGIGKMLDGEIILSQGPKVLMNYG